MKKEVWTWGYLPFTMGGACERPVKAEVNCAGKFDLGCGYTGCVFENRGKWYVAEETSGAIVGCGATIDEALKQVKDDIANGDSDVMKDQIVDSLKQFSIATLVDAEKFLKMLQ